MRLEYYTPLKKGFILQSKGGHLAAGLTLNTGKTKAMIFSRKRTPPTLNLHVNSVAIPVVASTTFLGVTVTSDLKWNAHISSTCAKAKQQLGFLYRFFYMADSVCLSHLYQCLVLPTLDYCSSVWDPAAETLICQLESVQRFAARLVTKRWSSPPDQLIHSLNWSTLQTRRKNKR